MKQLATTILLLITSLCFLETLQSQQMITEGNRWNVAWSQYPNSHGTHFLKLEDTTIVNGVSYMVVQQSYDSLLTWYPNGDLLRQDGSKVYVRSSLFIGGEHLLYDFSMQLGDSIYINPNCSAVVTNIDSVTLSNGEKRKRLRLLTTFPPGGNTLNWFEGVGSYEGLIYNPDYVCGWDASWRTLCFYQMDTIVHLFDPAYGCYVEDNSSVEQPNIASSVISLFPNPVEDELQLNFEKIDPPLEAVLYSAQGRVLMQKKLTNYENTIQFNHFTSGIYFLMLKTEDDQVFYKKILKE